MAAKAGWFPDPYDTTQYAGFRFWDGSAWTAKVLPYKPLVAAAPGSAMVRTATGAEIASLKRRWAAFVLDGFVTGIAGSLVSVPFTLRVQRDALALEMSMQQSQGQHLPHGLVADLFVAYAQLFAVLAAVSFVYYALMTGLCSATLGKLALGLRVVAVDGSRVKWWQAVVRGFVPNAVYLVGLVVPLLGFLGGVFVLPEWLCALVSGRKQSIHDFAAGTVVVRRS